MAYLRFRTELAIPLGDIVTNPTIAQIREKLPLEVATHLADYVREVRRAKKYAAKINEGQPNEEMTVTATYHICRHDEGKSCEAEQEI